MNSLDFNKYDDIFFIKDYDGFIDQNGYFYKVSPRRNKSDIIDHNLWAEIYIKKYGDKFLKTDFTSSTLFTYSQISSPSEILVNIYGFVYYSHDVDYHKPIIMVPNPKYNNHKMTSLQDDLLYNIMLLNDEHPENNPIFLDENVYKYVGMNENNKRRSI